MFITSKWSEFNGMFSFFSQNSFRAISPRPRKIFILYSQRLKLFNLALVFCFCKQLDLYREYVTGLAQFLCSVLKTGILMTLQNDFILNSTKQFRMHRQLYSSFSVRPFIASSTSG